MFFVPNSFANALSRAPVADVSLEAVDEPPVVPSSRAPVADVTLEEVDKPPIVLSIRTRVALACASHATRDFAGQTLGRLLGLGVYTLLATLDETPLRIVSGIAGAGAGGRLGYLIASRQIGTDSYSQRAAVGACTMVGSVIGGVIAGMGSNQIVSGVAAGSLLTAAASLSSKWAKDADAMKNVQELKTGAAIGMSCAGIGVAAWFDHHWKAGSRLYPARNLGLIVESTVIEICKSSFEKVGPSVNRNVLNFEGKVVATLLGMAPYVAATVLLNGYVSSRLQPAHDSAEFGELAAPLIVGAIANAIRGATNALVVSQFHTRGHFVADEETESLRNHAGAQRPEPETVLNKSCIRYLLSACRNAIYARLRDSGMSVEQASEVAQGVYACYAQCRDLIHDIARGEGWSEPRLASRADVASA